MPAAWAFEDGFFREVSGISLQDRGFRYGMSVFETVAIYHGRALFLDEHLKKLAAAAACFGFPLPAQLDKAVGELTGNFSASHAMLRIYETAGPGGPSDPVLASNVYAMSGPADFPTSERILTGYKVRFHPTPLASVPEGWKTGNYWPRVLAFTAAHEAKCDESLCFSHDGFLTGASMANVFVVRNGDVFTPPAGDGVRAGVLRDWVLSRHAVCEQSLTASDVTECDECFLTNSRLGVMPVCEIENRRLPSRNLASQLAGLYRETVLEA